MLLEICANSYKSALNANVAKAHRIELCQELSVGGITPSCGVIEKVLQDVDIPVFVLIRPRSGNFEYSEAEFDIMKKDIEICRKLGCQGVVSGILNENKSIDVQRTKALVELSKPLEFSFHRAFDEVADPELALEQLIQIGVNRILTSGQAVSADKGLALLEKLHMQSRGRLSIMAGAGINSTNVVKFRSIGLKEIHASASVILPQNQSLFASTQTVSDINKIKSILDAM